MFSENDILNARLAVAIDGEGSISIIRHRITKWITFEPHITITNKNKTFLEFYKEHFPFRKIHPVHYKGKEYYKITMRKLDFVLETLQKISPYLIIKKDHAELVIEYCKSRLRYQGHYTERELEIRKTVVLMNIKGRGHLRKYEKDLLKTTPYERFSKRTFEP